MAEMADEVGRSPVLSRRLQRQSGRIQRTPSVGSRRAGRMMDPFQEAYGRVASALTGRRRFSADTSTSCAPRDDDPQRRPGPAGAPGRPSGPNGTGRCGTSPASRADEPLIESLLTLARADTAAPAASGWSTSATWPSQSAGRRPPCTRPGGSFRGYAGPGSRRRRGPPHPAVLDSTSTTRSSSRRQRRYLGRGHPARRARPLAVADDGMGVRRLRGPHVRPVPSGGSGPQRRGTGLGWPWPLDRPRSQRDRGRGQQRPRQRHLLRRPARRPPPRRAQPWPPTPRMATPTSNEAAAPPDSRGKSRRPAGQGHQGGVGVGGLAPAADAPGFLTFGPGRSPAGCRRHGRVQHLAGHRRAAPTATAAIARSARVGGRVVVIEEDLGPGRPVAQVEGGADAERIATIRAT